MVNLINTTTMCEQTKTTTREDHKP